MSVGTDCALYWRVEHVELIIFGLLVGVARPCRARPSQLNVPYPITLGARAARLIGFVPGLPDVELDPDLVLLIFLPPLLYGGGVLHLAARPAPQRAADRAALDRRSCWRRWAPSPSSPTRVIGLGWAEAFVLGAIVSPTDAVAPAEILRRARRAAPAA